MNYPTNGYGERIYNPTAYDKAVSENRYGYSSYNSYSRGWSNGYSVGYSDGYGDACNDNGWQNQLSKVTDHS